MIEISVLNSNWELITYLDSYSSFIWTDRYNEAGDFELVVPVSAKGANRLKEDYYLQIPTTNRMMIIESIKVETDTESGNNLNVTGRSLEVILDRRIVWKQTELDGSIQNAMQTLINDAIISPVDGRRRIPNFDFVVSADPAVTGESYTKAAQYKGDSLYDVVKKVCQAHHLGFKMIRENGKFKFSMFAGTDKSYNQDRLSYLLFSPNVDNLKNSKYLTSIKKYKNVLRIAGQGEGATQTYITHYLEFDDDKSTEMTGLDRREIYIDCSDVSSITDGNTTMDVEQYTNVLVQKGIEKMVDLIPETAFEGEIDATIMYKYHEDFEVGDLCEIENEYGMHDTVRIAEVVQTWEAGGYSCIPTLQSLKDEYADESSGGSESNKIVELVETTSTTLDTAGLKVQWKDIYGSSEDATITYLTHNNVKMTTQLMSIKYYSSTNTWKITILKDHTTVKDITTDASTVYNRMQTLVWNYDQYKNYEVYCNT